MGEVWKRCVRITSLAIAVAAAPLAGSEPLPCAQEGFLVDASNPATQNMICTAASSAREALAACGLVQTEPIEIETVDSLFHQIGRCLAVFDCHLGRIQIIEPDLLRDHLPPDDPYAFLPDDVVFRSVLTHELAHALVDQQSGDREIPLVDHEYIANALELAALPPQHRATLLGVAGVEPPVSAGVIDIFIYGLAPRRFAAASYLYFAAHGCETITGILDGTASFRIQL